MPTSWSLRRQPGAPLLRLSILSDPREMQLSSPDSSLGRCAGIGNDTSSWWVPRCDQMHSYLHRHGITGMSNVLSQARENFAKAKELFGEGNRMGALRLYERSLEQVGRRLMQK
jgi:hypothetical protein